ncbi:hypothetical protein V491_04024 [Pseudogymnoascus sp. VKM F-3775]|nr:hypothetical protein V491_04024 [Pseudogymnoascus sp. VKM F-3775]
MSCGGGNENCSEVVRKFDHSGVGNQCSNLGEEQNRSLQQIVHNDTGDPPRKKFGIDVETTGVINPGGDKNVYEEPILVVTPEWQRQRWLLEVSQSAEDNPESVMSVNSEIKSDGGGLDF